MRGKANLDSTKQLRAARLWTVEKMGDGGDGVNLHPGKTFFVGIFLAFSYIGRYILFVYFNEHS